VEESIDEETTAHDARRRKETKMKYLLLIYGNEGDFAGMSEAEQGQIFGEYMAYSSAIKKSGHYLGGEVLQPVATATTVRELAAEAGRLEDAARTRLGLGGDVASTTATTLEMADAVAAFHFPDDLWARLIYDLVICARSDDPPIETLVAALVPVYFGRVGSFVIENRDITTEQAEDRVERQARQFELLKPYLVERWNASVAAAGRQARESSTNGASSSAKPRRRAPAETTR
jgi:hypothetical protein